MGDQSMEGVGGWPQREGVEAGCRRRSLPTVGGPFDVGSLALSDPLCADPVGDIFRDCGGRWGHHVGAPPMLFHRHLCLQHGV